MDAGIVGSLGGLNPFDRYSAAKKPLPSKDKDAPVTASPKDTVSLSKAAKGERLDQIREKLKRGYYDTESVRDAVSDKLTGLFDSES